MNIADLIELRKTCEKRIIASVKNNRLYDKGLAHVIREELLEAFNEFGLKHKKSFEQTHKI